MWRDLLHKTNWPWQQALKKSVQGDKQDKTEPRSIQRVKIGQFSFKKEIHQLQMRPKINAQKQDPSSRTKSLRTGTHKNVGLQRWKRHNQQRERRLKWKTDSVKGPKYNWRNPSAHEHGQEKHRYSNKRNGRGCAERDLPHSDNAEVACQSKWCRKNCGCEDATNRVHQYGQWNRTK